jgi:hypothetical protein
MTPPPPQLLFLKPELGERAQNPTTRRVLLSEISFFLINIAYHCLFGPNATNFALQKQENGSFGLDRSL